MNFLFARTLLMTAEKFFTSRRCVFFARALLAKIMIFERTKTIIFAIASQAAAVEYLRWNFKCEVFQFLRKKTHRVCVYNKRSMKHISYQSDKKGQVGISNWLCRCRYFFFLFFSRLCFFLMDTHNI